VLAALGQGEQEAAHLRHREREQAGIGAPPFSAASSWLAARRVTAREAWASRARVTKRCQAVQVRTSYWSRPTSPFAWANPSSTCHRMPHTRTSSSSAVPSGP
jgi:hypothetical protein